MSRGTNNLMDLSTRRFIFSWMSELDRISSCTKYEKDFVLFHSDFLWHNFPPEHSILTQPGDNTLAFDIVTCHKSIPAGKCSTTRVEAFQYSIELFFYAIFLLLFLAFFLGTKKQKNVAEDKNKITCYCNLDTIWWYLGTIWVQGNRGEKYEEKMQDGGRPSTPTQLQYVYAGTRVHYIDKWTIYVFGAL